MPHPLPDNSTDDDRQSAEQTALAELLRNFFADEIPPEIRELSQKPTEPTTSARPDLPSQKSRRRLRTPLRAALGLAIGIVALLGWWRSSDDHPDPTPRIAAIPNHPAPKSHVTNQLQPVRAPRPRDPFAPRLTRHLEPSNQNPNVLVDWTRVELIDPASATRLTFEIPTELRFSPSSKTATGRPAQHRQFTLTKTNQTSHPSTLTSQLSTLNSQLSSKAEPVPAPRPAIRRRNYLGVFTATPGPLSKTQPFAPLGGVRGLEILDILPDSPAAAAGLHAGDILVAFNGEPLDTAPRLAALIVRQTPGETIRLDIAGPRGFRTIEATIYNRVFATSRSNSRTWRLPKHATLRGRETFSLSAAGWPKFPPMQKNTQASSALWLRPAAEGYELLRLSSSSGQLSEEMIWRGTPSEMTAQDVPENSRKLGHNLRDAWTRLAARSLDESPRCRIRWSARNQNPALEILLMWEAPTGEPAMLIGQFPLRNNPLESLAWLCQEPEIQLPLEEIPASDRNILRDALQTMHFPPIQRTLQHVQ